MKYSDMKFEQMARCCPDLFFKREWFDRPAPARVHSGPPRLYQEHGLKALVYPDYIEVVECNPEVDAAGFILGLEVPR